MSTNSIDTISRTLDHHRSTTSRDLGLLVARVVVGVVFVAHGWQKWSAGIGGTQEGFAAMGIPAAEVSALGLATLEVVGGILLVLGALTPVIGVLFALSMAGAWWYVHRDAFYVADGGFEFVLVLGALTVALALTGPGRFSLDGLLARRR